MKGEGELPQYPKWEMFQLMCISNFQGIILLRVYFFFSKHLITPGPLCSTGLVTGICGSENGVT